MKCYGVGSVKLLLHQTKEVDKMYAVRSSRSSMDDETKKIVRIAKKQIDSGINWRVAIQAVETIEDTVQREKARKSIIEYAPMED